MGAGATKAKAGAKAAMAPPEPESPKHMTLELRVSCTQCLGTKVELGLRTKVMDTICKKTSGAIRGNGTPKWNWKSEGMLSASNELTICFPMIVDMNTLIKNNTGGGGKLSNMATNLLDKTGAKKSVLASMIKDQVSASVSAEVNGVAGTLQETKVY
jgi:hypothetical protein